MKPQNRSQSGLGFLLIGVVVMTGCSAQPSRQVEATRVPPLGRYQVVALGPASAIKCDTQTGDTWFLPALGTGWQRIETDSLVFPFRNKR